MIYRYAAAWTIGEFARNLGGSTNPVDVLGALLQPQVAVLPAHIQSVFVQNSLKVFGFIVAAAHNVLPPREAEEEEEEENFDHITPDTVEEANTFLTQALIPFTQSVHIEVQERACFVLELLKLFNTLRTTAASEEVAAELAALFDGTLNPVAKGAQRKVAVPEDVDLDTPINPDTGVDEDPFPLDDEFERVEPEEEDDLDDRSSQRSLGSLGSMGSDDISPAKRRQQEEAKRARDQRASNPYILGSGRVKKAPSLDDSPANPVVTLPSGDLGSLVVGGGKDDLRPKRKPRKAFTIKRDDEAPEGGNAASDDEDARKKAAYDDPLSSINLDDPLTAADQLPVNRHRTEVEAERRVCCPSPLHCDHSNGVRERR